MRNIEPIKRTDRKAGHDFNEVWQKKGSKRNKTVRGGGLKGKFLDLNTGKSYLGEVWEMQ